jgi:uncharacterized protein DUF4388
MALKGTLKDFGIAEILQLIGQQAKSGVLHLVGRDEEIHISMADGCVVRAEHAGRKAKEKLGTRLVGAEIITRQELDHALEVQKRTLRRLGDLLVELGLCSVQELKEMTALQTTETVYRLFHWKSGTYEFVPGEVEWDPATVTPLRAESVLMEGFRQVDEWPVIRRRITSAAMTFGRLRPLEAQPIAAQPDSDDVAAAFDGPSGEGGGDQKREFATIGDNERRCYRLADPGRTVERIGELSRLGEFETCKALLNLVNAGYLDPVVPSKRAHAVGDFGPEWPSRIKGWTVRAGATLVIAAALAGLATWVDQRGFGWGASHGAALRDNGAQRFLARTQLARLRGSLEVYRLEHGEYPERLGQLVETGLASPRDLRYPWMQDYYYRRRPEGRFVLLPPVE